MKSKKPQSHNYQSLSSSSGKKKSRNDNYSSVLPAKSETADASIEEQTIRTDNFSFQERSETISTESNAGENLVAEENESYSTKQKRNREEKKSFERQKRLNSDNWIARNGHNLTFFGIFLFTFFVFFRPYELIPGASFLSSGAFIIALATLLIYLPTQLTTEGNLTIFTTEVKAILALALIAFITVPIAKDPQLAWATINDNFLKAVLMFIVMVNVIRTRQRLTAMLWLAFLITIYISYSAIDLYFKGEFKTEGYRVSVEMMGLFNNPNDMALHLITMIPIVIVLGLATKKKILKWTYFSCGFLFFCANMVTFSRGGFLGLIASSLVLMWKLGRGQRLKYALISLVGGGLFVLLAPGNYGLRLLSIFLPGLDPNGSADARRESLILSLIVTARNPWGIGIGNFPIVGIHNLVSHNAFTQVSAELGLLGLAAYLIFMISPFRKLSAIEHTLEEKQEYNWFFYLSIGLQASIVGYWVSSFFGSVAYNWYIYYLIAYAIACRRVYQTEQKPTEAKNAALE